MRLPIPPGLLCAACTLGFAGDLARRTPVGWVHATPCVSPTALTEGRWVNRGGVRKWVPAA